MQVQSESSVVPQGWLVLPAAHENPSVPAGHTATLGAAQRQDIKHLAEVTASESRRGFKIVLSTPKVVLITSVPC